MTAGQAGEAQPHEPLAREGFQRLVDQVLASSKGSQRMVTLHDVSSDTTRFANNHVIQHVAARRISVSVTVAFGRRHGTATTTDVGAESLRDTVDRAERLARLSPEDPEFMPPLPPQAYPRIETMRDDTRGARPDQRVTLAAQAIDLCRAAAVTAAGIVSSAVSAVGVAANTGLFAYEPRTEAKFSITAMGRESSGWAAEVHRSIDALDIVGRTRMAVQRAVQSAAPKEIPPGRYTVVLEPPALSALVGPMIWMLDAKSYDKRTSPFTGKLGHRILDARLSLANHPTHADLLGNGFNSEGLPAEAGTWIENGTLKQLRYDRYTAEAHQVPPSPAFDAPILSGNGTPATADALIRGTERGILVSNFWYIRTVNPTDLTLTGMTRDGTFLIEDGRVSTGLVNMRWHDSPLRVLAAIDGLTAPQGAVSNEYWKMLLPTIKLPEFHFSSVTRF